MVKEDRKLIVYILLTIITFGIYGIYFLYKLIKDVNIVCAGDGQQTPGLLKYFLLSLITFGIYGLYWMYCLGNRLAANAPRYKLSFQENGTTVLLWQIFGSFLFGIGGLVAMHIILKNTNALARSYNDWCMSQANA